MLDAVDNADVAIHFLLDAIPSCGDGEMKANVTAGSMQYEMRDVMNIIIVVDSFVLLLIMVVV